MSEGIIKRKTDRGFGFISGADGRDVFFHMSVVEGTSFDQLQEGQRVEYVEGRGDRGPKADSVRAI